MSEIADCINSLSAKDILRGAARTGPPFYINVLGLGGLCAEYEAIYATFTNPPASSIMNAQNAMWCAFVDAGIDVKFDVFYLFAQTTQVDALLNWANLGSYDCDLPTAITFTALEGFTGNAVNQYISTNWIPSAHASNYALNDAGIGVYIRNDLAVGDAVLGGRGPDSNGRILIYPKNGSDDTFLQINSNLSDTQALVTSGDGLFICQRTGAATTNTYRNDATVLTGTAAAGSLPNGEQFILAYNNQGSPLVHSAHQVACVWFSSALDASERTITQNAIETYMDSNGKGVIP